MWLYKRGFKRKREPKKSMARKVGQKKKMVKAGVEKNLLHWALG